MASGAARHPTAVVVLGVGHETETVDDAEVSAFLQSCYELHPSLFFRLSDLLRSAEHGAISTKELRDRGEGLLECEPRLRACFSCIVGLMPR